MIINIKSANDSVMPYDTEKDMLYCYFGEEEIDPKRPFKTNAVCLLKNLCCNQEDAWALYLSENKQDIKDYYNSLVKSINFAHRDNLVLVPAKEILVDPSTKDVSIEETQPVVKKM